MRTWLLQQLATMPVSQSRVFMYPRMYPLSTMAADAGTLQPAGAPAEPGAPKDAVVELSSGERVKMPQLVNLSADRLTTDGAFLLDDGVSLFLWLGRAVPQPFLQALLGLASLEGVDCATLALPALDSELSQRVRNIVRAVRDLRPLHAQLHILKEGEAADLRFYWHLVEDRASFSGGSFTYAEYLNHINRQSQTGPGM
jgi:protein transport protein SEC24